MAPAVRQLLSVAFELGRLLFKSIEVNWLCCGVQIPLNLCKVIKCILKMQSYSCWQNHNFLIKRKFLVCLYNTRMDGSIPPSNSISFIILMLIGNVFHHNGLLYLTDVLPFSLEHLKDKLPLERVNFLLKRFTSALEAILG